MSTDARSRIRKNSIKVRTSVKDTLELYTSHYDARKKISAKRTATTPRNLRYNANKVEDKDEVTSSVGNVIRGIRKNQAKINIHRTLSGRGKRKASGEEAPQADAVTAPKGAKKKMANYVKLNKKRKAKLRRESTFTGKSLLVSTVNDLFSQKKKKVARETTRKLKNPERTLTFQQKTEPVSNQTSSNLAIELNSVSVSRSSPERQLSLSSIRETVPARLLISNLHPSVTEDDIMELFGALGPLREGRLITPRSAEVIYTASDDAFTAYEKYHGRNLDGQPMLLTITSVDEEPDSLASPSSSSSSMATPRNASKPVMFTVKL